MRNKTAALRLRSLTLLKRGVLSNSKIGDRKKNRNSRSSKEGKQKSRNVFRKCKKIKSDSYQNKKRKNNKHENNKNKKRKEKRRKKKKKENNRKKSLSATKEKRKKKKKRIGKSKKSSSSSKRKKGGKNLNSK